MGLEFGEGAMRYTLQVRSKCIRAVAFVKVSASIFNVSQRTVRFLDRIAHGSQSFIGLLYLSSLAPGNADLPVMLVNHALCLNYQRFIG